MYELKDEDLAAVPELPMILRYGSGNKKETTRQTNMVIYIYINISIYMYIDIYVYIDINLYIHILAAVPELPVILRYGSCGLLTKKKGKTRQTNMVLYI